MIYICGDTHANIDVAKLINFADVGSLIENDYIIVAGDFGMLWSDSPDQLESELRDFYNSLPCPVLFVDGNHENHTRIDNLPKVAKFLNVVGQVSENIFHLQRGRVYVIGDKKVFTFGGGHSIDWQNRTPDVSWWSREIPENYEYDRGMYELQMCGYEVDLIITHTCSTLIFEEMKKKVNLSHKEVFEEKTLRKYFDMIQKEVSFKHWFFGHFHQDMNFLDNKVHALYTTIVNENGEQVF